MHGAEAMMRLNLATQKSAVPRRVRRVYLRGRAGATMILLGESTALTEHLANTV